MCELTYIFLCQFLLFRFQQHLTFRTLFVWFLLHWWLSHTCSERGRCWTLYIERGSPINALSSWNFSASMNHLTLGKMIDIFVLKYTYSAYYPSQRRGAGSCFECQGGRLCNKTGLSQPLLCPVGHYCPPDSSAAVPCPSVSISPLLCV